MIFLLDSYDMSIGSLWASYWNSIIFLLELYDISMGLIGGSIGFLWDFFGVPIGFP